ncbi:MAG TPA: MoxR family ATPase, partial [Rubrivivax sp.]|nr:MoxR family ATPase [Rubrivivax sp.]
MKVLVDYPSEEEEFVIAERVTGPAVDVNAVADTFQLAALQRECRAVFCDPALMQYAVKLVGATRRPDKYGLPELAKYITYGASPRATIGMIEGAKALAMLRGRRYVLPEDMTDLVPDVMRHRVVLSYEALAENITADALVQRVLAKVAPPDKPLAHAPGGGTAHG